MVLKKVWSAMPLRVGRCSFIAVAPGERSALPGYQVLLSLLEKTGDRASYELYLARANELARDVDGQR